MTFRYESSIKKIPVYNQGVPSNRFIIIKSQYILGIHIFTQNKTRSSAQHDSMKMRKLHKMLSKRL